MFLCDLLLVLTVGFVVQTFKTGFAAGKGATNRLLAGLPQSAGWLMESILTFLLVFVVFTATDQGRAQSTSHLPVLAPAAIGMAIFICHLAAVPIDGCSVNRKSMTYTVIQQDPCEQQISVATSLCNRGVSCCAQQPAVSQVASANNALKLSAIHPTSACARNRSAAVL